ncbi:hypothetical protein Lwal_3307 [Legionella waltersii]|uniref:Uncharacterized protein n=1 Tax=Legionella waltersii TaxID=66969 RepID=A0A0W1A1K9_9GAMM|nr:hypothetical protein Lwal_3307 [Legionella waltersii]
MVRKERLELSRVAPLEPKSSASTNSATFAIRLDYQSVFSSCKDSDRIFELEKIYYTWGERWDSNPRQPGSQPGALPTELRSP